MSTQPNALLYPKHSAQDLGADYIAHVMAMTSEGLHSKSDIAVQLAWRDAELRRLHAERDKLHAFAQDIMDEWPEVGSLDGYDLQMLGVKHGLLVETTHHKPCAEEGCNCAEMCDERDWQEGVQCYRSTQLLKGNV